MRAHTVTSGATELARIETVTNHRARMILLPLMTIVDGRRHPAVNGYANLFTSSSLAWAFYLKTIERQRRTTVPSQRIQFKASCAESSGVEFMGPSAMTGQPALAGSLLIGRRPGSGEFSRPPGLLSRATIPRWRWCTVGTWSAVIRRGQLMHLTGDRLSRQPFREPTLSVPWSKPAPPPASQVGRHPSARSAERGIDLRAVAKRPCSMTPVMRHAKQGEHSGLFE